MTEGAPGLDEYRAILRPVDIGPHAFVIEGLHVGVIRRG